MNNYLRGEKRICPFCSTKFYDLNRPKVTCSNCKNEIIIKDLIKKTMSKKNSFPQNNLEELRTEETTDFIDNGENDIENNAFKEDNNSTIVDIDD